MSYRKPTLAMVADSYHEVLTHLDAEPSEIEPKVFHLLLQDANKDYVEREFALVFENDKEGLKELRAAKAKFWRKVRKILKKRGIKKKDLGL